MHNYNNLIRLYIVKNMISYLMNMLIMLYCLDQICTNYNVWNWVKMNVSNILYLIMIYPAGTFKL